MSHTSPAVPLFAQRSGKTTPSKASPLSVQTPERDDTNYYIGAGAAFLLLCAVAWYARRQWLKLRPKLALSGASAERERPGAVEENLDPERWEKSVALTLKGAESALRADGSPISAKAAAAIQELNPLPPALATITCEAAAAAVESGELQSRLVAAGATTVYALVCPARHAHVRQLRGHAAFAGGWLDHAARVRRGLGTKGPADLLCLLFFLGPDARDGTLAVAYESADGRLATAELVDGDAGADGRPLRRVAGWGFQLADGLDRPTG